MSLRLAILTTFVIPANAGIQADSWSPVTSLDSRVRDCRKSPKRGFDKHVLSTVEGLSLSSWGLDFKGSFPLTLSPSKGVFDFSDSLVRGNDNRRETTS
jgi:hypothetical protein